MGERLSAPRWTQGRPSRHRRPSARKSATRQLAFLSWMARQPLHLSGLPLKYDLAEHDRRRGACARARESVRARASASFARLCHRRNRDVEQLHSALSSGELREIAKAPDRPRRHQGQQPLDRAPPRATWTTSASSASTPMAAKSSASAGSSAVHLRRVQSFTALTFRCCASASTGGHGVGGLRARTATTAKALINILETFPRDLLFQLPPEELLETALGILHQQERQRLRLFVHRDPLRRVLQLLCIVYVPSASASTPRYGARSWRSHPGRASLRRRTTASSTCCCPIRSSRACTSCSAGAPGLGPRVRRRSESGGTHCASAIRAWTDHLQRRGARAGGRGTRHPPAAALRRGAFRGELPGDLPRAHGGGRHRPHGEQLGEGENQALALSLVPLRGARRAGDLRVQALQALGAPFPLSRAVPMLENMGVKVEDEHPCKIKRSRSAPGCSFTTSACDYADGRRPGSSSTGIRDQFHETFRPGLARRGRERRVQPPGASCRARRWREIVVLRACCKFLRQAGIAFSAGRTWRTALYAQSAGSPAALVRAVPRAARSGPATSRPIAEAASEALVGGDRSSALDAVANLDEDRILRSFLDVIAGDPAVRTSTSARADGDIKRAYLSFKLGSERRPRACPSRGRCSRSSSTRRSVEGVHLRGGTAARGGLRWSDRREDFRTEVLGLMKAQMVKNAVIVPVGSKGGFVVPSSCLRRRRPRPAWIAEGQGLLPHLHPRACWTSPTTWGRRGIVKSRRRRSCPARRATTRTWWSPRTRARRPSRTSPTSIAEEYGFWLGDAFASGGLEGLRPQGHGHYREAAPGSR